ncbi:MAG TPA: DoxX family membrane protein [Anaeromyxobacter sp.]
MTPFIVLVVSLLFFRALGAVRIPLFRSWITSLRWALAVMFLVTASAHFGDRRPDLVRMVPSSFPDPELLVTLSGVAELLGAAGLLLPRLAPWAATGLALLLVAVFPANVHAARTGLAIGGVAVTPLVPRAALQMLFLAATLVAGFGGRRLRRERRERRDGSRSGHAEASFEG